MDGIVLFVNARDEPAMEEWIIHHLCMGFSHIVVFDHKSIVPLSRLGTFRSKVTIIPINLPDGSIKVPLMNRAINMARLLRAEWMMYLDADEFLYLKHMDSIGQLLRQFPFADAVTINWLMFGTSHHITQPDGLIMSNFTHCDSVLNPHVKSIVRPHRVTHSVNPHYFELINPARSYHVSKRRMPPSHPFFENNRLAVDAHAYIAHYMYQSEDVFHRRKGRPMDDGTTFAREAHSGGSDGIHAHANKCVNTALSNKYAKRINEILKRRRNVGCV